MKKVYNKKRVKKQAVKEVLGMDVAINERNAFTIAIEDNQREVRKMVMESYEDMLNGKGRDYKEFFAELEGRYRKNV